MNFKRSLSACSVGLIMSATAVAANDQAVSLLQQGYGDCKSAHMQRRKDIDQAKASYGSYLKFRDQAVATDADILSSADSEVVRVLGYCETVGKDIRRFQAMPVFQKGTAACGKAAEHLRSQDSEKAGKAYKKYLAYKKQAESISPEILNVFATDARRCERLAANIQSLQAEHDQLQAQQDQFQIQLQELREHLAAGLAICQTAIGNFNTDTELQLDAMKGMLTDINTHFEQVPGADMLSDEALAENESILEAKALEQETKVCRQSVVEAVAGMEQVLAQISVSADVEEVSMAQGVGSETLLSGTDADVGTDGVATDASSEEVNVDPATANGAAPAAEEVSTEVVDTETPEELETRLTKNVDNYELVKRVSPRFPKRAAKKRKEGYVVVKYTINTEGKVVDPVVVESSPRRVFDGAAIAAIKKWQYKPAFEEGVPLDPAMTRTRISFALAN